MANYRFLPTWWAGTTTISPHNVEASVANGVDGGIPVLFRTALADAATADYSITVPWAVRVVDFWIVKTAGNGAASNTVQLKSGANAITNSLDANVVDTTMVRASTIDDARHELAAGGELRVTNTKSGGNAAAIAYTLCVRI